MGCFCSKPSRKVEILPVNQATRDAQIHRRSISSESRLAQELANRATEVPEDSTETGTVVHHPIESTTTAQGQVDESGSVFEEPSSDRAVTLEDQRERLFRHHEATEPQSSLDHARMGPSRSQVATLGNNGERLSEAWETIARQTSSNARHADTSISSNRRGVLGGYYPSTYGSITNRSNAPFVPVYYDGDCGSSTTHHVSSGRNGGDGGTSYGDSGMEGDSGAGCDGGGAC